MFLHLTYGHESILEMSDFLENNKMSDYSLSIFDKNEQRTVEIDCDFEDIMKVIMIFINVEHAFPRWIGINPVSESYVVGMEFTRGRFHTPSYYKFQDGRLLGRNE